MSDSPSRLTRQVWRPIVYRSRWSASVVPGLLVALAALLLGLVVALGDGSGKAIYIAFGLAVLPLLALIAHEAPAAGLGLFVALQLLEPYQIESPVGTLSPGIAMLALLVVFLAPELARAYKSSPAVRMGIILLFVWLSTCVVRLSYESVGSVLRQTITNASFVAIALVAIALAPRHHAIRNVAIGAAFALMTLGVLGALAGRGLIPHPTRQWDPSLPARALIGIRSPFIRNYGLNVTFDSVDTLLPLCLPYLLLTAVTRGRRGRLAAWILLISLSFFIIFVFQTRDMLLQIGIAIVAFLLVAHLKLGCTVVLLCLVLAIPFGGPAVRSLEGGSNVGVAVSTSLREVDLTYVIHEALSHPEAYLLGTNEIATARAAAASIAEGAILETQKDTNIHSFFLENLVAGGWLAFFAVLAIYAYAARCGVRGFLRAKDAFLMRVLVVGTPTVLFIVMFEPVVAEVTGTWLFVGLIIGYWGALEARNPVMAAKPPSPHELHIGPHAHGSAPTFVR